MKKKMSMIVLLLLATTLKAQNQQAQKGLSITVNTTATGHSVTLKWTPSTTTQVTATVVYRSVTTGTGYAKIAAVATPTATYIDTTVANGQTYFYVVTASAPACVSGQTIPCGESVYSNEASGVIPATLKQKKPKKPKKET